MDLYVILRRSGWRSPEELGEAAARSKSVADERDARRRHAGSAATCSKRAAARSAPSASTRRRAPRRSASTPARRPARRRDHRGRRHGRRPARSAAGERDAPDITHRGRRPRGRRPSARQSGRRPHAAIMTGDSELKPGSPNSAIAASNSPASRQPRRDQRPAQLREREAPDLTTRLAAASRRRAAFAPALRQPGIGQVTGDAATVGGVEATALGEHRVVRLDARAKSAHRSASMRGSATAEAKSSSSATSHPPGLSAAIRRCSCRTRKPVPLSWTSCRRTGARLTIASMRCRANTKRTTVRTQPSRVPAVDDA